jgi:hypothetical protein
MEGQCSKEQASQVKGRDWSPEELAQSRDLYSWQKRSNMGSLPTTSSVDASGSTNVSQQDVCGEGSVCVCMCVLRRTECMKLE